MTGLREGGSADVEGGIALLKKARDLEKAQVEALLPATQPQAPCPSGQCGRHLNALA